MAKSETPLLDELEKGPWPSFVTDMKQAAKKKENAKDLCRQLEQSYVDKIGHWKHGGIVGVKGYGSGVIGRYSDMPDKFPGVEHFHTLRVNQPSGWFYNTKIAARPLRRLGQARFRPHQLPRRHRRHHPAGHQHRSPAAVFR